MIRCPLCLTLWPHNDMCTCYVCGFDLLPERRALWRVRHLVARMGIVPEYLQHRIRREMSRRYGWDKRDWRL